MSEKGNVPSVEAALEIDPSLNPIRFFMQNSVEPRSCTSKADVVDLFCFGLCPTFHTEQDSDNEGPLPKAVVDDRLYDENGKVARTHLQTCTTNTVMSYEQLGIERRGQGARFYS